jgi:hypothetical protein
MNVGLGIVPWEPFTKFVFVPVGFITTMFFLVTHPNTPVGLFTALWKSVGAVIIYSIIAVLITDGPDVEEEVQS